MDVKFDAILGEAREADASGGGEANVIETVQVDGAALAVTNKTVNITGKQNTITTSNKLAASLVSGLATVATSGSYADLSNKPTIPTVTNSITSGSTDAVTSGAVYTAIGNLESLLANI